MKNKTYLFEYNFNGETYGFTIEADSMSEAVSRVRAIGANAQIQGEALFRVYVPFDLREAFRRIAAAIRSGK
jgi:hypothetical protein